MCTTHGKILHGRAHHRFSVSCQKGVAVGYSDPVIFPNSVKLAFSDSA